MPLSNKHEYEHVVASKAQKTHWNMNIVIKKKDISTIQQSKKCEVIQTSLYSCSNMILQLLRYQESDMTDLYDNAVVNQLIQTLAVWLSKPAKENYI